MSLGWAAMLQSARRPPIETPEGAEAPLRASFGR